ncbi:hypothetical protein [Crateriforma conspicua]|uniref:hypothetical protein n=1 Tax=Crateriforma conspicua TaxID=2527996 RepID=UPI00118C244A|nr:hypothetical protein [Crateriforma conspicua]QDV66264.1 hypothetical protein Mal65_54400 [Crateriforma conspicua]
MAKYHKGDRVRTISRRYLDRTHATNEAADAGRFTTSPPMMPGLHRNRTPVRVINRSGATRSRWSVMRVTGMAIDPSQDEDSAARQPVLEVELQSSSNTQGVPVVLWEPLQDDQIGEATISGITPVLCEDVGPSAEFLIPVDGQESADASDSGPMQVIWSPELAADPRPPAIVHLGSVPGAGESEWFYQFELTSDPSATEGTADITDGAGNAIGSATVYDPRSIFFDVLLSGDGGYCIKSGGKYYAVNANCPARS